MNSFVIKWVYNFLNAHQNLGKPKFCEISHVFCQQYAWNLSIVSGILCFHTPQFTYIITTRQTIVKKKLYSYIFYVPFKIRGWGSFLKPTVWISPSLLFAGCWVLCGHIIKLTPQLLLVLRLRMSGDVLSLPYLPSLCVQWQFLPSLQQSFNFRLNQCTFHYANGLHVYTYIYVCMYVCSL